MTSVPGECPEPDRQQDSELPVCLALEPDPVFGFLHKPSPLGAKPIAVLITPPFGWEEQSSYRGRRAWAASLANAGYPAFRLSFPGTGDSGGSPADPDRLEAWTDSVSEAALWLRGVTGCSRVAAIGIGLGGLVVANALAADAPIDDVVLWAVSRTGRKMVRELRAHSKFVAARYPPDARALPPLPENVAELTGFLLSAETERALEALDLSKLPSPPADRRILLIGRDGVGIDERLAAHLGSSGAAVTVTTTSDHASLMTEPQEAQVPLATIDATLSWLAEAPPTSCPEAAPCGPGVQRSTMELVQGGVRIREKAATLEIGGRRVFAMVCEPVTATRASAHAVFLGAAALPHAGPNRAWVELARRWATLGVPSVRMDLAGIGDANGDERGLIDNAGLYSEKRQEEVLALLDRLQEQWGWDRFVLVGLCAGAHWSLHAALARRQVAAALMINLYAFFWSDALILERDRREATAAMRSAARAGLSRHDLTASNVRRALRGLAGKLRPGGWRSLEALQTPDVDRALDLLRDQGTQALLLLSAGEPLYEQFEREGRVRQLSRWPNLTIERIPSPDHMFRDLRAQRFVHEQLDRALERVLSHSPELTSPAQSDSPPA